MVTTPPPSPVILGPVLRAALAARLRGQHVERATDELRDLAREEAGLSLRLAMVLACIKQFDLVELGYSGFLAFCKERVDWKQAWVRALVRLVESPLDLVKAAAASGQLPLRVAVQAPGRIREEDQEAWLGGAELDATPPRRPRRTFTGDDVAAITEARTSARVCMGRASPIVEVDAYILQKWRERVPGEALVEGRTPPPAPQARILDFRWVTRADERTAAPAEALVGPWDAPATLDEALDQFEAVQAARRGVVALLARAFALALQEAWWCQAGFASPWAFAESVLGWSRRTAQRYRKLGRALHRYPELDEALRQGFSPEAADRVGRADGESQFNRWFDLARHLGQQELIRAFARQGTRLEAYVRALEIARRHAAELLGPNGPTACPAGTRAMFHVGEAPAEGSCADGPRVEGSGADGSGAEVSGASGAGSATSPGVPAVGSGRGDSCAEGPGAEGSGAPGAGSATSPGGIATEGAPGADTPTPELRVALPFLEPEAPSRLRAHPDLAVAARWFLENNPLPRPVGFGAVKRAACFRCQNPECGRVTLRVEAHHIHWRRHGGADHPANAVTVCPVCHLRLLHAGAEWLRVSRVIVEGDEARLWEYPDRPPVLQFCEVPPE